jgi:hypothetical protein
VTINSRAEYEAAKRRILELGDLPEGTPGAETELTVLVELTTAWEAAHADDPRDNAPAAPDPDAFPRRD